MKLTTSFSRVASLVLAGLISVSSAHAALFEDDEARRAILDLRQRVERQSQEIQNLQRSLLEQQNQFESLRGEISRLRGEKEQISQELGQELRRLQALSQSLSQGFDERLKKFEPTKVKADGVEFLADPAEIKAYEEALSIFRSGDFAAASNTFNDFVIRYPKSGYVVPAFFWLGNAQYASRDYKSAIRNFNSLLTRDPGHARAPEAMLSVANCQLELKDSKAARKTFADLIKAYPQTEAASAATERLAKLK
jgi:tol-pal system protein YbgF